MNTETKPHTNQPNRKPKQKFTLPEDLYRGWVNPVTQIVPEKLGL